MSVGDSPRFLVIVRRGQAERFTLLAETFARDPVQVIWDRRTEEGRGLTHPSPQERRRRVRRGRPPESWTAMDFLVVTHA
jgi:hypothetical protein